MDYHLDQLDDTQFENLVNTICQKILGTGVVTFSPGKDGGKDGRFNGTAQNYPSTTENWKGKFIIQAKHTTSPIASCSDSEFESIVNKEIKKVRKLKSNGHVDNYLLFTNRKYSGIKGDNLKNKLAKETGLTNCEIIGKETINNQYLNGNKDIVKQYGLQMLNIPFHFSDEEIKDIILAFKTQLNTIDTEISIKSEELKYDFSHIEKDRKNAKNNLGNEYYTQHILGRSLVNFDKITDFLNNPINEELKEYYYDTAHELNELITLRRDDFEAFEELFVFIYQLISHGANSLKGSKRHITTFLHYMYVECLIGQK